MSPPEVSPAHASESRAVCGAGRDCASKMARGMMLAGGGRNFMRRLTDPRAPSAAKRLAWSAMLVDHFAQTERPVTADSIVAVMPALKE